MTDLRKAAEQALGALERSMEAGLTGIKVDEAITAIRIALDDPLKSGDAYRVAVAVRDACHKAWVSQMENWRGDINIKDIIETTIGNQALAQPEQEHERRITSLGIRVAKLEKPMTEHEKQLLAGQRSLLRTAPPRKPWVSLTDDELETAVDTIPYGMDCIIYWDDLQTLIRAIEAKLKEKNT